MQYGRRTRVTFQRRISLPFFPSNDVIVMLTEFLCRSVNGNVKASCRERDAERRRWLASRRRYYRIKQECMWTLRSQFSNFRDFKSIFRAEVSSVTDFFPWPFLQKFRTNFLSLTSELRIWSNASTWLRLSTTYLRFNAKFLVVYKNNCIISSRCIKLSSI